MITNTYPVFIKLRQYQHQFFKDETGFVKREDYGTAKIEQLNVKIRKDIEKILNVVDKSNISYFTVDDLTGIVSLSNEKPNDSEFYYVCIEHEDHIYIFMYAEGNYILMNYGGKNFFYQIIKDSMSVILPRYQGSQKYIFEVNKPYCKYIINTYSAFCNYCNVQLGTDIIKAEYNDMFLGYCLSLLEEMPIDDGDYHFKKTFQSLEDEYTRSISLVRYNNILIIEDFQRL